MNRFWCEEGIGASQEQLLITIGTHLLLLSVVSLRTPVLFPFVFKLDIPLQHDGPLLPHEFRLCMLHLVLFTYVSLGNNNKTKNKKRSDGEMRQRLCTDFSACFIHDIRLECASRELVSKTVIIYWWCRVIINGIFQHLCICLLKTKQQKINPFNYMDYYQFYVG